MAVLVINTYSSTCGECGRGASPRSETHDVVVEYSPRTGEPGCGVRWTQMRSDYVGIGIKKAAQEMRPDLEWVGFEEDAG